MSVINYAFLGLDGIPGLGFLSDFNITGFLGGAGKIIGLLFLLGLVGIIFGVWHYKKKEKKLYNKTLHFFEDVNGMFIPVEDFKACELKVPGTNTKVFYIKENDTYLPRGARKMGKNSYWYGLRKNGEIVNFSMKNLDAEMNEAGLDYDHTDMRYAFLNLTEIIKRNYRDKSTKWWKEYKDVISTVIYIFVISLGFFFLLMQIGKLIDRIAPLLDVAKELVAEARNLMMALDEVKSGTGSSLSGIVAT